MHWSAIASHPSGMVQPAKPREPLNRSDIIRMVANKQDLPFAVVEGVIDSFLDAIALSLACGEEVNLRTFGKFEPRQLKAVTRVNPKSGVVHEVPEKTGIRFAPSPNLKARLNRT